ncbi:DUF5658 family protein [Chloroflexota bacterium]
MKYLLGLLVILNISDALLTHFLVKLGIASEGNSFLAPIVGQPIFFVLKFLGVLIAALILWDISRRRPRLALIATSCSVAVYCVIVLWNINLFPIPSLIS